MSSNRNIPYRKTLSMIMILSLLIMMVATTNFASKGDFSTEFVAAAPLSYNHSVGGGAYDDRTIGREADVVTSLQSSDFKKDDIVTYFTRITVAQSSARVNDSPQTIEIDYEFTAYSTGQPGAGFSEFVAAMVNRGTIVDLIPGEDNIDSGNIEVTEDSIAEILFTGLTGELFANKSLLKATVKLDGLEYGESVILRTDVRVDFKSGATPTGNLQATIKAIRLVNIKGTEVTNQSIPVGNQTVPFKIVDYQNPMINIDKTTKGYDNTFGDGVNVEAGEAVTWKYIVTNPGNVPLSNIIVRDDNGTPAVPGDDFTANYISGDSNLNSLLDVGEIWTFEFTGTAVSGSYSNTAAASGKGPDNTVVNDSDTSSYTGLDAEISIDKKTRGFNGTFGDGVNVIVGQTVLWKYTVTNPGNTPLSNVVVEDNNGTIDDVTDDFEAEYVSGDTNSDGLLDPGEEWIFEATGTAVSGSYSNKATATADSDLGEVSDFDTSSYSGKTVAIRVTKVLNAKPFATTTYTLKVENLSDPGTPDILVEVYDPRLSIGSSGTGITRTMSAGALAWEDFTFTLDEDNEEQPFVKASISIWQDGTAAGLVYFGGEQ